MYSKWSLALFTGAAFAALAGTPIGARMSQREHRAALPPGGSRHDAATLAMRLLYGVMPRSTVNAVVLRSMTMRRIARPLGSRCA